MIGEVMSERTLHRAFVTGLGAVTPIGNDVPSFWEGLSSGRNGISRVTSFDPTDHIVQIAGEVKDFDPEQYLERRVARRTGRFAQFSAAAGLQALEDSGIVPDEYGADDIGVVIATSGDALDMGPEWEKYLQKGSKGVDPFIITRMGQHMAAARLARQIGVRGPNTTINTACALSLIHI